MLIHITSILNFTLFINYYYYFSRFPFGVIKITPNGKATYTRVQVHAVEEHKIDVSTVNRVPLLYVVLQTTRFSTFTTTLTT